MKEEASKKMERRRHREKSKPATQIAMAVDGERKRVDEKKNRYHNIIIT